MEFLNPGMLGRLPGFLEAAGRGPDLDLEGRRLIARAVRPVILRRTKQQVLPELPPRVEQTVYCDLEPEERRLYDELRDHYRNLVLEARRHGVPPPPEILLEGLLRLRQMACHPGLVDRGRVSESSTKLDVLASRLAEADAEGHKTIVFSQFTRLLALVQRRLEREGMAYEYLDGGTVDREHRVRRFQEDDTRRVSLVSLKAGGLGLNLTAADHVILLDPWWNPAAEAQAIDRAHRIGQSRSVLACRLIARDTVEERVLELQSSKRALSEGIIGSGGAAELSRSELEALLS